MMTQLHAHAREAARLATIARPVFHHLKPDQGSGHQPTLGAVLALLASI
jgi:hypothetical protein